MSQRTLADNVLHGFWCHTAAVRNSGLAPPDNDDCTSTLSRLDWFSVDQCRRGRSKPGGQTDGSATREWFTTSVSAHSSLHAELAVISYGGGSSQIGFLDDRQAAGCSVMSVLSGNLSFSWTLVSSLAVASCHRRCGSGMFLRTGNHGSGVERRVPVIVHIDVFNWMSSSLVWDDLDQTGAE